MMWERARLLEALSLEIERCFGRVEDELRLGTGYGCAGRVRDAFIENRPVSVN